MKKNDSSASWPAQRVFDYNPEWSKNNLVWSTTVVQCGIVPRLQSTFMTHLQASLPISNVRKYSSEQYFARERTYWDVFGNPGIGLRDPLPPILWIRA